MNFKYIILENLINSQDQNNIENLFLGDLPKWEKRNNTTTPELKKNIFSREKDIVWFAHELIVDNQSVSRFSNAILEIFQKINFKQFDKSIHFKNLQRLRANLVPPQRGFGYHNSTPSHTDMPFEHFSMIYYVNDCDGQTVLNGITKLKPKKGKIVLFDGSLSHKIMYPKSGYRCILNFNFMKENQNNV
jgi:hypothetical protein